MSFSEKKINPEIINNHNKKNNLDKTKFPIILMLNTVFDKKNTISIKKHKENFKNAPEILKDTFTIQDDGSFLVK